MFSGASMFNFYWMEGPLAGDEGSRVTVLHAGQVQQCSNCLKLATSGCPGKGNGKACVATGTPKTMLGTYMDMIRMKHGYRSLKAKYYEQFPNLGGTGSSGMKIIERDDGLEDNTVPINPIQEKDQEIASLKQELENSTKANQTLGKQRSDMKSLRWTTNVNKNKIDFARKVVEQSINLSIADSTMMGDRESELVSLYSTLIDEEEFELAGDDSCISKCDFLVEAEKHLLDNGASSGQLECLKNFKWKIKEAVKKKKLTRRSRKDSIGSNSGMKRSLLDQDGRDHSRVRLETE